MITVKSRLHRTMRGIGRMDMNPDQLSLADLDNRLHEAIALYCLPEEKECIYFAEEFIAHKDGAALIFTNFSEIERTESIVNEKLTANTLIIFLKNGESRKISVSGGDGNNRDFFSFVRFMTRVVEDKKHLGSDTD
jgi:hypothetical protein